jgi:hypothetical protein
MKEADETPGGPIPGNVNSPLCKDLTSLQIVDAMKIDDRVTSFAVTWSLGVIPGHERIYNRNWGRTS